MTDAHPVADESFTELDTHEIREWLILLPDGEWFDGEHAKRIRNGQSYVGTYCKQEIRVFLDLAAAVDTVTEMMKQAADLGATQYRPIIYSRIRRILFTTPEPDEHAESILGPLPIVVGD